VFTVSCTTTIVCLLTRASRPCRTTSSAYTTLFRSGGPVIDTTNMTVTPETCAGNDGSITGITVSGGNPTYTYAWTNAGGSAIDVTDAPASDLELTVKDGSGRLAASGNTTIGSMDGP